MVTAADIVKALGGRMEGRQHGRARCPACGKATLWLTQKPAAVLFKCWAGCDQQSVIAALRDAGLWHGRERDAEPRRIAPPPKTAADTDADEARRQTFARRLWDVSRPISDTPAQIYLRRRGITADPGPALRFHPNCPHPTGGALPALIAAITSDAGEILAIQRTWLRSDGSGKAPVAPAKATLGPMRDGAVRLGDVHAGYIRTLGLAEGIETALSARQLFSLPTWAVLGCSRLGSIALPEAVDHVIVFADAGEAGMAAADKAAREYERRGLRCDIEAPPADDWNTFLQARGAA